MPSRCLSYLKITKGEHRDKMKTQFSNFDFVKPLPIFHKFSKRWTQRQIETEDFSPSNLKKNGKHRQKQREAKDVNTPLASRPFILLHFVGYFLLRSNHCAICTALRAAPFLIWSPTTQNVRPHSLVKSLRIRPT